MKKLITLLLALTMALSLCACGSNDSTSKNDDTVAEETIVSKEDLMAEIGEDEPVDMMTLQKAVLKNKVKAKQDYFDRPIAVSGKIRKIEEDYVCIMGGEVLLHAYIPTEDLVNLENGNDITVVGIISDIQDLDTVIPSGTVVMPHCIMDVAYLAD